MPILFQTRSYSKMRAHGRHSSTDNLVIPLLSLGENKQPDTVEINIAGSAEANKNEKQEIIQIWNEILTGLPEPILFEVIDCLEVIDIMMSPGETLFLNSYCDPEKNHLPKEYIYKMIKDMGTSADNLFKTLMKMIETEESHVKEENWKIINKNQKKHSWDTCLIFVCLFTGVPIFAYSILKPGRDDKIAELILGSFLVLMGAFLFCLKCLAKAPEVTTRDDIMKRPFSTFPPVVLEEEKSPEMCRMILEYANQDSDILQSNKTMENIANVAVDLSLATLNHNNTITTVDTFPHCFWYRKKPNNPQPNTTDHPETVIAEIAPAALSVAKPV